MDRKNSNFDMEIIHKRGKGNIVDDAFSRKDEEVKSYAILVAFP